MATKRYYSCKCSPQTSEPSLFNALQKLSLKQECETCGQRKQLHLVFSFATGAEPDCKVLGAFLPHHLQSWRNNRKKVVFYPFLVVLRRADNGKQVVWLPYWHAIGGKMKYGQWAPFMDESIFKSLLRQARASGYLRGLEI